MGDGLSQVFLILLDVRIDGVAPGLRAADVDVFLFGQLDGELEGLREVGKGGGRPGFDVAAGDGGEEAAQGGGKIAAEK